MSKKAVYTVMIPIAGAIHIEVEAASEDSAIEKAWEKYDTDGSDAGDIEWDAFESLVSGNVLKAPLNHIEVVKHGEFKPHES